MRLIRFTGGIERATPLKEVSHHHHRGVVSQLRFNFIKDLMSHIEFAQQRKRPGNLRMKLQEFIPDQ